MFAASCALPRLPLLVLAVLSHVVVQSVLCCIGFLTYVTGKGSFQCTQVHVEEIQLSHMPLLFVRNEQTSVLELVSAELAKVAPQVFRVLCSCVIVQDVLREETFRANVAIEFAFKT